MGWIPSCGSLWMVSTQNFVSVTPSMEILFPIIKRNEVSTHWSSFFLIFLCFANCILDILPKFTFDLFGILSYEEMGLLSQSA